MISALLWLLAALVALILLAVSVPLRLRLQAHTEPHPVVRLQGSALGLPYFTFVDSSRGGDEPVEAREPKKEAGKRGHGAEAEKKEKAKKKEKKGGWSRPPRGVVDLMREVLACIRVVRLWATGAFGLDDPADTGTVFGLLTPLIYATRGGAVRLDVRPVFDGVHASGDLDAIVELRLIELVPPAARFGWRNVRVRFA